MTGYNPGGEAIEWGKGDINRIYRLCLHYDRIQSERDSIHGKENKCKRYKLRRCMLRIHKKIRNLVDKCHHRKFARWLCENHHLVILLPEFKTKDMVKRGSFRKKSTLKLRDKRHIFVFANIYFTNPASILGARSSSALRGVYQQNLWILWSDKTFKYPSCGATIDRDVNGAHNVLFEIHYRKQESAWPNWRWSLHPRHLIVGCLVGLVLTYRFNVRG